jgi:hypothetical protein
MAAACAAFVVELSSCAATARLVCNAQFVSVGRDSDLTIATCVPAHAADVPIGPFGAQCRVPALTAEER